jgi:hypothetical protein
MVDTHYQIALAYCLTHGHIWLVCFEGWYCPRCSCVTDSL